MPVPTAFSDLSTTAASNSPAGTEDRTTADDYFRQAFAFVRKLYDGETAGQIQFPATQNASTGANVLDDYEENTWTPALNFGGSTTGVTYSSRPGKYTKIGRLVVCDGYFLLTSKGAQTGAATITGLPFATDSTPAVLVGYYFDLAGLTGAVSGYVSTSTIALMQHGAAAAAALTDANFTDTSQMTFSVAYMV